MNARTTAPAKYAHLLVRLLQQQGLDCRPTLAALGLDEAGLAHPEARLNTATAHALFRALLSAHGQPDLGLRMGRLVSPGFLGEVGHALLSCASLREALDCCAEFSAAISPSFRLQVVHLAQHSQVSWVPLCALPYDYVLLCFDVILGAFDNLLTLVAGPTCPPYEAYLTRAEPRLQADGYRSLKARCHFGEPGVPSLRIEVSPALREWPMPMHNAEAFAALRDRLVRQAQPTAPPGQTTEWITMMLSETHGEQPSQAFMAQVAGVSPRTLSRLLAHEGTTYRNLAGRVRFERACRLLREGSCAVHRISEQLGYADAPSFVRAFRAEAGMAPGRYRALHGSPGGDAAC